MSIQIHLTLHQDQEDTHVDFPFDPQTDDIDEVASEFIEHLQLTQNEKPKIIAMIKEQLDASEKIKPVEKEVQKPEFSSDDEPIDDPEYQKLIAKQVEAVRALEKKHADEQQELLMKLKRNAPAPSYTYETLLQFS